MNSFDLFKRQKLIQLGFGVIGVLGALIGFIFYLNDLDSDFLISTAIYPIFIFQGLWNYYELNKYYFHYSNSKIEYKYGYQSEIRIIEL